MEQAIQIYHVVGEDKRINKTIFEDLSKNYKLEVFEITIDSLSKIASKKVHLIIFDGVSLEDIHYSTIDLIQNNNQFLYTALVGEVVSQEFSTKVYEEHIDYLFIKAFDDKYFRAKLRTVLKRTSPKYRNDINIVYKNIVVDRLLREISVDQKVIDTTSKEYKLIKLLVDAAGEFIARKKILMTIWGYEEDTTRLLDQYMHHIKIKFKDLIEFEFDKELGIRVK